MQRTLPAAGIHTKRLWSHSGGNPAVLSSRVAGTMAAKRTGLQTQTLRNLLLGGVLTLPVCIFLGAALFASGVSIGFNVLGLR